LQRDLTPTARDILYDLITTVDSSPLFVSVAFEAVCSWSSYHDMITSGRELKEIAEREKVRGLIDLMFRQLEEKHGTKLVSTLLGIITLSREGLSEKEAEDIISTFDDVLDDIFEWWVPPVRRISPMLVYRIIKDLGKFMIKRKTEGGLTAYTWYHRQFWEAAQRRYLGDENHTRKYHSAIGLYFCNAVDASLDPASRSIASQPLTYSSNSVWEIESLGDINYRRVIAGSYHLIEAEEFHLDKAVEELCNFDTIRAAILTGNVMSNAEKVNDSKKFYCVDVVLLNFSSSMI